MNRHIYIKSLFLLLIFGLAISCADQKTEAAQNTIESDPVQSEEKDSPNGITTFQKTEAAQNTIESDLVPSEEKDRPNGITTLVVTGNVHGQIDPCG